MAVNVLHFDVFTTVVGKGNPAGIVLSADELHDTDMQVVAAKMGFGDTAFISSSTVADFRIRYFSPKKEVELCGHATIAASIALFTHGVLAKEALPYNFTLETKAGVLPITVKVDARGNKLVFMSQAPAQFRKFGGDRQLLADSLGITVNDFAEDFPIVYGSTGRWTLIVPVSGLNVMRNLQAHPTKFAEVLFEVPAASIHPFCFEVIDPNSTFHARHFSSPTSGTVEDPVTGTASGVLGAYYREFVDKKETSAGPLVIEQGYEMGREGTVLVWTNRNADSYEVSIAGMACFVDEKCFSGFC